MPELHLEDVRVAYDESGDHDAPPVVLLHGLSSARSTWRRLTPVLRDRFRLLAVDQRGHGESSHAPDTYTLEYWAPDAMTFCEKVAGAPAILVGHGRCEPRDSRRAAGPLRCRVEALHR